MATTIQVSSQLLEKLKSMKMYDKESYEDIMWDLLEDRMELSAETKKNIAKSIVFARCNAAAEIDAIMRFLERFEGMF